MIIEGIALTARRLPRFTYLTNVGPTTINADNNRRRLRLVTGDPHTTNITSWTGMVKRSTSPGGPSTNVTVLAINEHTPVDEIDVEQHGDLVKESFTFACDPASNVAMCWEFYS